MSSQSNRRQFMATSAALASVVPFSDKVVSAKSYSRILGSNERLGVGLIGHGGMGGGHAKTIAGLKEPNNLDPIAVADCWKTRAESGAKVTGAPHAYQDYRKVLDHKEIDYVTIATPEHWHCDMTLDAFDAGKDVYCEKPMTHTLEEGVRVFKKQKETGRVLQVGVQGMSDDSYISARKAIDDGVLGQVVQAQIEYVRRYGEQGPWRVPGLDKNMPKPADLDWNAWLGSAKKADWNPNHYFEWRNYSMYSGGIATDLFIHRITRIMKACNLLYPNRVVGMGGIWQWDDGRDLPDNFEMICEYPRGMTVYVLGTMSNRVAIDHVIRGYRGTLQFNPEGWVARNKDGEVLAEHKKSGAEDINLHHSNLHAAIRDGAELNCPVELGMAGVSAVCMANESWRTGQMMGWDPKLEKMVPASQVS
ncbi:MAG: Gfo/Idh/MocA family oxidoreductase [Mariniblastus sp.]|nr:Gfo/Idh/MocA family oxidoreductase [Mariniblastus sp.]